MKKLLGAILLCGAVLAPAGNLALGVTLDDDDPKPAEPKAAPTPDDPPAPEPERERRRGGRRGFRLGGGAERYAEELGLSADQVASLEKLGERYRPQMEELVAAIQSGEIDPEVAREEMELLRDKMAAEQNQILTPEQQQKLTELQEQRRQRRGGGRGGRGFGRGGAERFAEELGLSAEQTEKLNALAEKYRPQMQELFGAMRSGEMDPEAMREQMTQLRDKMTAEQNEILSPEQQQKLAELMEQRRGRRGGGRRPEGERPEGERPRRRGGDEPAPAPAPGGRLGPF